MTNTGTDNQTVLGKAALKKLKQEQDYQIWFDEFALHNDKPIPKDLTYVSAFDKVVAAAEGLTIPDWVTEGEVTGGYKGLPPRKPSPLYKQFNKGDVVKVLPSRTVSPIFHDLTAVVVSCNSGRQRAAVEFIKDGGVVWHRDTFRYDVLELFDETPTDGLDNWV